MRWNSFFWSSPDSAQTASPKLPKAQAYPQKNRSNRKGEAAQPQQGKRKAVCREHLACADVQKNLFYPGKPGHECARHGHKEEQLYPGAQPCAALFVPLALLCRR